MENHIYTEPYSLDYCEYTSDWFVCGLCGVKTEDIEGYVKHMVLQEHCVLHLCPSTSIRDLLLPRFSKKRLETEELDVKHVKNLGSSIEQEVDEDNEEDIKVVTQAAEVETGDQKRLKCHLCGLTFSRQAAILNHFKLQHAVPGMVNPKEVNVSTEEPEDIHVKQEVMMDCKAPVKHIIAVESSTQLDNLATDTGNTDKTWNKLACHLCGQIFKTGKILRTHISVVHSQGRPFHCSYEGCSQSFKTKGSLIRHQRRHTGERPYACQLCGRCFRESGSLTRHQQSQLSCITKKDSQIPLYGTTRPLDACQGEKKPPLNDIKINTLLKQEGINHPSEDKTHPDQMSWAAAETKSVVRTEEMSTSVLEMKAVKQEDNSSSHHHHHQQQKQQQQQQRHVATEPLHPLVPCKTELPAVPREDDLAQGFLPQDTRDASNEELGDIKPPQLIPDIVRKSFTCPLCSQNYSKRSTLENHMKIHLEDLGDKCSECGKSFSSQQALSRHLSSHSSTRQFVCQLCNKGFKLLSHARAHLLSHSSTKTIPCRHCSALFKTKSARNIHENIHSNVRAFVCVVCQKAFITKASLIRHLRIHTGEMPFCCRYCGRSFKEHGTLSRHLKHKLPCARQASMDGDIGDVGIRLVQNTVNDATREISDNCNGQVSRVLSPEPSVSESVGENAVEDTVSLASSFLDEDPDHTTINSPLLLLNDQHIPPSSFQLSMDQLELNGMEESLNPIEESFLIITDHNHGHMDNPETIAFIPECE